MVREPCNLTRRLGPLYRELPPPKPGEWLDVNPEPGQSFADYVMSDPATPTDDQDRVYIQPLGSFTEGQRAVVEATGRFIEHYFQSEVEIRGALPLSVVPDRARREGPGWGKGQVLSTYVLYDILEPRMPKDAAAYIAFTSADLWPGPGWNFVFGQASLQERVGVWSIWRGGDPDAGEHQRRQCLLRTLKTGVHELGHMFGMAHCTQYQCGMNGSNSREEADRRPLALCPECAAKVCHATGADPVARYEDLAAFCREEGLQQQADFYERCVGALAGTPQTAAD